MSAGGLAGVFPVLTVGALLCSMPAVTRPTVQFGVRVPRERAGAPVIRRERRAYHWRTAAIGACCTVVAVATMGYGSWWLSKIILLLELAADLGCFWVARRKIAAVKNADGWFAGLRQTVVADTSWRTDPPRFPVRWLVPALAVMAATAAVGALRYPGLPAHIVNGSGHRPSTTEECTENMPPSPCTSAWRGVRTWRSCSTSPRSWRTASTRASTIDG